MELNVSYQMLRVHFITLFTYHSLASGHVLKKIAISPDGYWYLARSTTSEQSGGMTQLFSFMPELSV